MERSKIILKSGKDQSMMRLHPWVFSGAIKKIHGDPSEGDLVEVFNNKDEILGFGHFQKSSIAVRILSFDANEDFDSFFIRRIEAAWKLRIEVGLVNSAITNVFRWVNAEGDGLPGLIIDFYNGTAVIQMHSIGMYRNIEIIAQALKKVAGDRLSCIYDKSSTTLPFKADLQTENQLVFGKPLSNIVQENSNSFEIDWVDGQKTGFFIDQRENRKLLGEYAMGKKVLNMFAYTGGFSVYALHGGASLVHTVDSSKKATELSDRNIQLNFPGTKIHQSFAEDASYFLTNPREKYDLIILDPPAFAKHQNVLSNALQGYKKLNRRAFEIIEPGGILFTFSCSQVVSRENFRKSVFAAAANTGRKVSILNQLSQPSDHPVSIYHPEGEYLKGLVLKVE
ncbi:MAG: class I SAM-dependent rRNA methyltransferase [Bacteroidales bacterium]|nr:class I SAM-dependent rRNA methyltransferase [Bacteroidales bacterium]MCF8390864.1 class I SAM-dependent rRNA methyltransferase [Bacteroidales bacterium]